MKYCRATKKIIAVLVTLLLLFNFTVVATEPNFTISGESLTVERGDTVSVKFSFENNPGVSIISLNLVYDSDVLELTELEGNPLMGGNFSGNTEENYVFWCNYTGDVSFDGVAFTVYFYVKDNAPVGVTTISAVPAYSSGSILNNDYEDIAPDIVESTVIIKSNYYIGDINTDGEINFDDMSELISILLEKRLPTETSDVTNNGIIDITDLVALKKLLIV